MSIIKTCLRKSVKSNEPANILTIVHDLKFDYDLCLTPHIFYGSRHSSQIGCNPITKNKPDNFIELPNEFNLVKNDITFDFVLCNSRDRTYDKALQFSNALHIPIIIIDNSQFLGRQKVAASIHINPTLQNDEIYSELIEYMVDIPEPSTKRDIDVLICNQFMKDEYHIVEKIKSSIKDCVIIGDNVNLSKSAYDEEYIDYFNRTKIYINLSTYYGISSHLLQAMVSGCAVISNKIPIIENLLGDNILYIKNVEDVSELVNKLLDDEELLIENGNKMKQIAQSKFKPKKFIDKWTKLFYRYKDEVFTK